MEADIAGTNIEINWNPKNLHEELIQNVQMIISSVICSCPMDRDFALNGEIVDRPMNLISPILKNRIIVAIKKYEPRVSVKSITFQGNVDGVLKPIVKVVLPDE